jgi:hypothetical protein
MHVRPQAVRASRRLQRREHLTEIANVRTEIALLDVTTLQGEVQ